jgi:hypothetical protein
MSISQASIFGEMHQWIIASHSYAILIQPPALENWLLVSSTGEIVFITQEKDTAIYVRDWLIKIKSVELRERAAAHWIAT